MIILDITSNCSGKVFGYYKHSISIYTLIKGPIQNKLTISQVTATDDAIARCFLPKSQTGTSTSASCTAAKPNTPKMVQMCRKTEKNYTVKYCQMIFHLERRRNALLKRTEVEKTCLSL